MEFFRKTLDPIIALSAIAVLDSFKFLLMGFGIRLAYICNVSTFFGLMPEMNLGGYLAMSGIVAGAWVGSKIYKRILEGDA